MEEVNRLLKQLDEIRGQIESARKALHKVEEALGPLGSKLDTPRQRTSLVKAGDSLRQAQATLKLPDNHVCDAAEYIEEAVKL